MQAGKTAFDKLDLVGDEATGANIVKVALDAPLRQIAVNAGLEGGVVVEKVRNLEAGHGLNAATGEYVDLLKAGIIDPAKVTRSALQNAASIAALFLTTEAVVADKPEKDDGPGRCAGRRGHGLLSPPHGSSEGRVASAARPFAMSRTRSGDQRPRTRPRRGQRRWLRCLSARDVASRIGPGASSTGMAGSSHPGSGSPKSAVAR